MLKEIYVERKLIWKIDGVVGGDVHLKAIEIFLKKMILRRFIYLAMPGLSEAGRSSLFFVTWRIF